MSIQIYSMLRGFEVTAWLCDTHRTQRESEGWEVGPGRQPKYQIGCEDCEGRAFVPSQVPTPFLEVQERPKELGPTVLTEKIKREQRRPKKPKAVPVLKGQGRLF